MVRLIAHPRATVSFEDFATAFAGPAIALDGFVCGPSRYDPSGPHFSFDHHEGCDRFTTRATCEQVLLAIRTGLLDLAGDGADVYVNDADGDVCLSVWLLRHPDRVDDPGVAELVAVEGLLDSTGGTVAGVDADRLAELAWVLDPYWTLRASRTGCATAAEMVAVIDEVGDRIDALLAGRGGRVPDASGYRVLGRRGPVAAVVETGPLARARMRADGIDAFVSVVAGSSPPTMVVGKMSPFVPVDLGAVWGRLNELEQRRDLDRWGGSDTIGGSPRAAGTALSVEEVLDVVASCCTQRAAV